MADRQHERLERGILQALAYGSKTKAALHVVLCLPWTKKWDNDIGRALVRLRRRGRIKADRCVWRIL